MAGSTGRRTSSSNQRKRSGTSGTNRKKNSKKKTAQERALFNEIGLIVLFVVMIILFFCNFGVVGPVGDTISGVLFGIFGLTAYFATILLAVAFGIWYMNPGNSNAIRKVFAGTLLFISAGVVCDLVAHHTSEMELYQIKRIYEMSRDNKNGGGIIGGSISYFLQHYLGTFGAVLVVLLCVVVGLILLTEKSVFDGMKRGGSRMREISREESRRRREYAETRRIEQEQARARREEERRIREEEKRIKGEEKRIREEEKRLREEEKENQRILRMDKKVSGVAFDTSIPKNNESRHRDDIHEIILDEEEDLYQEDPVPVVTASREEPTPTQYEPTPAKYEPISLNQEIRIHKEGITEGALEVSKDPENDRMTLQVPVASESKQEQSESGLKQNSIGQPEKNTQAATKPIPKKYIFPPLSRLQKGSASGGDSSRELKETALRLQQTLNTFGVKVTITDISQGPSVTRYELQPEQGVKVSKIVGLSDDIKLNLAATDIRIEAPIPGKAAVGIEVPNKENKPVALRDLLESREFKEFPSNLAFAVGKDIGGKTVVADIAKMPHMLIAGATGSGKSVCINTLIMSILYKAHPDDVKLIMIDPKVVELSVYNGIPHLLIPVVTDPKKASAALHWGVSEMEDRYRKFADFNVRDLKGYNKKIESMPDPGDGSVPAKLPQIVIIVDELADLMMVSPGEVEESICRLAQLARAAGIHLIIATQRPSVDVITGLIKANMPSRVAFSVSSGVDSRTILDMNGAEKLLGKGDMLFYPQGYTKPARIQGAFVSDKEVSDVVDFLKNQMLGNIYAEDIEEKIRNMNGSSGSGQEGSSSELDELFEKAGRFIIEKDKASIGMLQRAFKIGFNRAARIMDQLSEMGVVGEEEGTKPRKILMGPEQFDQLVEEIL